MNKAKPTLASAIKEAVDASQSSTARLAQRLSVRDGTVRQWLSRNTFPEEVLGLLAVELGLQGRDELEEAYSFNVARQRTTPAKAVKAAVENPTLDLEGALLLVDKRMDLFARTLGEFDEDVQLLFSALGNDDVFVYWSIDLLPFEMDEDWDMVKAVGSAIANAITKGARFIYLHPNNDIQNLAWDRRAATLAHDEYQEQFNNLRAKVVKTFGLDPDLWDERVKLADCQCDGFVVPYHKYVLFKAPSFSPPRLMALIPSGTNKGQQALHLPLDRRTTASFLAFVRHALTATVLKNADDKGWQEIDRLLDITAS